MVNWCRTASWFLARPRQLRCPRGTADGRARHCCFLDDDGTVLPVYPHFVAHQRVRPEQRWAGLFGAGVKVARIDRVISINREFEVFSRFFAPETTAKTPQPGAQGRGKREFQADSVAGTGNADQPHRADDRPYRQMPVAEWRWRQPTLFSRRPPIPRRARSPISRKSTFRAVGHKLRFDSDLAR